MPLERDGLTLDHGPWFTLITWLQPFPNWRRKLGVRPDTIRYYERVGLLPSPDRSPNGYRSYGEIDVERLRFIRGAQRLGLKLRDIRELLAIRDKGVCPCGHTAKFVERRLADLDAQIVSLEKLRREMALLSETLLSATVADDQPWPCDVRFIRAGGGEN